MLRPNIIAGRAVSLLRGAESRSVRGHCRGKRRVVGVATALAILGSISVGASWCAAKQAIGLAGVQANTAKQTQQEAAEHRTARYQIQSQDELAISFPLSPEFDETATVEPDGYINLLGAGDLFVRGLTIPGIVEAIKGAYSKLLNSPIINVDLKDFQTPFFVVSGQVAKPGQFALRYETTVSEAMAIAGGPTPAAKSRVFLLRRAAGGGFTVVPLNLKEILAGRPVEDSLMNSGDMLYVPEKFITKFRTYVPYSVGVYASPQLVF